MLITREMDYAIRVVRSLFKNGKMSASEITEIENIPISFAYKVLKKLSKAGIVEIIRGANGGYVLKASDDSLTMFDILTAIEKNMFLTECLLNGYTCSNNGNGCCGVHKEFCRIQSVVETELKRTPAEMFLVR